MRPLTSFFTPKAFKTRIEGDGVVIVDFLDNRATSVVIPAKIDGRPVVKIDEGAFCSLPLLTSFAVSSDNPRFQAVDGALFTADGKTLIAFPAGKETTKYVIPDCVETVGAYAFSSCDLLTSVEIPASVKTIGDDAFAGCDLLTSVKIPNSVETIGDGAFYVCDSLTSVEIPDSVETIGDGAFYACDSLTSVEIPNSVETIGDEAFDGCAADLTLYGAAGSAAEKYARENQLRFEAR
ncbi:MAG: leucine-rich repeat domain-containing protein [Thermoguttaceae bacterium]|nr:leucine-rich repeat domain-containing protein [Thermoguttaceae bacterium]